MTASLDGDDAHDTALAGLRVVELCRDTAGMYCAKLLADLGAHVIKVVDAALLTPPDPPTGDAMRLLSARTAYLNTSKHLLDCGSGGDAQLAELVPQADIVIVDVADDIVARAGVSPADGQVWCTIRPFGSSGPYAHFRGEHLTVFHSGAEARFLRAPTADLEHTPPVQGGSELGQFDTGVNAAVAVLAAARFLRSSGTGQRIDVSAQESLLTLNRTSLSRFLNDGVVMQTGPRRLHIGGLMPCQDGYVQVSGLSDRQWQALVATSDGACFEQFVDETGHPRDELRDDLRRSLTEWCSTRTKREIVRLLRVAGCAVAEFADADDLVQSEQLEHRGFLRTIDVDGQPLTIPGPPFKLSLTPADPLPADDTGGEGFPPRFGTPEAEAIRGRRLSAPLDGVRILDFSWLAAGPYTTLLLSFLGADVIKVESSRRIDLARLGFFNRYDGIERSPNFNELNLDKRGIAIDLSDRRGVELVWRLAG